MNKRKASPIATALTRRVMDALPAAYAAELQRPGGDPDRERGDIVDLMEGGYNGATLGGSGRASWGDKHYFAEALQDALLKVVIEALALEPCHITGMHTPDHHVEDPSTGEGGYVCRDQLATALQRFVEGLEVQTRRRDEPRFTAEKDLPRKMHDEGCGWCHRIPNEEKDRKRLRAEHVWGDEEIPAELAARGK